ncbi:MAG: WYL domain-containing protein [Treponema sp.]|nr:WYL domain-containing protein [Treponema sp.]
MPPAPEDGYAKRSADPHHAICQRGNWYFIGHSHDKQEPRMFSFLRAQNVTLTGWAFRHSLQLFAGGVF